jgi:signal transduction histidine kinase
MSTKKKKYFPKKKLNPAHQAMLIKELTSGLEKTENVLQTVIDTYERHMGYLSNFASHNMGNAIQSMYAILAKNDHIDSSLTAELTASIDNLNGVLESFKQVVTCTHDKEFNLKELMTALETMTRSECKIHGINVSYNYERNDTNTIGASFQNLLQILHNLMTNSVKALRDTKNPMIEVNAEIKENQCMFLVKDNGCGIAPENDVKIFEYKYTTTEGGSGIGLFFVKYMIENNFNGQVNVKHNENGFSTIFEIIIPMS